jgi:hypothetical protein
VFSTIREAPGPAVAAVVVDVTWTWMDGKMPKATHWSTLALIEHPKLELGVSIVQFAPGNEGKGSITWIVDPPNAVEPARMVNPMGSPALTTGLSAVLTIEKNEGAAWARGVAAASNTRTSSMTIRRRIDGEESSGVLKRGHLRAPRP